MLDSEARRANLVNILAAGPHPQRSITMAIIPEAYLDLLTAKVAFANLATVLKDGSPQVTPIWFDYTGGKIRINTARGRVKARTLKPGARVALAIMDPDNAYRFVQVRGRVTSETENGA